MSALLAGVCVLQGLESTLPATPVPTFLPSFHMKINSVLADGILKQLGNATGNTNMNMQAITHTEVQLMAALQYLTFTSWHTHTPPSISLACTLCHTSILLLCQRKCLHLHSHDHY